MQHIIKMQLEKAAKSGGGDKYSGTIGEGKDAEEVNMYIPQTISRPAGKPVQEVTMTINVE